MPVTVPARRAAGRWIGSAAVVSGLLVLPAVLGNPFRVSLVTVTGIYAILALATNLLFGYTGLLSLGQNGFFAIAAYAMVISQARWSVSPELAIGLALLLCAGLALVVGMPVLRLRGHYLAMATLAFGIIVQALALRWSDLTGGVAGVTSPPLTILGLNAMPFLYYVAVGCAAVVFLMCHSLVNSKIGRVLQAIRDDETAAQTLGINTTYYKMLVFILAAVLSGIAGLLYAYFNRQIIPGVAGLQLVIQMLTMVIVGGLASNLGAIIGAVFVVMLPQLLARFDQYQLLVYGALVLGMLVFAPRGLVGVLDSGRRFVAQRLRRAAPPLSDRPEVAGLPRHPAVEASARKE